MHTLFACWSLFFSAFIAATLLPAQSELVLSGLILADFGPVWLLILVATAGNVLGSFVNWLLGRFLMKFQDKRWFPMSKATIAKAESWYGKYGRWSLLLSWAPIIGDPLTLGAGILREPLKSFFILVTIAKGLRYCIVTGVVLHWF